MKLIATPIFLLGLLGLPGVGATAAHASSLVDIPRAVSAIPQRYGVFEEPLVAIGAPATEPGSTLRKAIATYRDQGDTLLTGPLETWLANNPDSAWAASLNLNIGLAHKRGGDYAPARQALQKSLASALKASTLSERAVGERALAELLDLESGLGHGEAMARLLQTPQASWGGYATGAVSRAQYDLAMVRQSPEDALRCGLVALSGLLHAQDPHSPAIEKLRHIRADKDGIALSKLETIAGSVGLSMRAVRRGAGQPVPVPSVVHWKEGHYAAIVGMENGRYRVRDSALSDDVLMRPEVLERQSSGYFLVPQKTGEALAWRRVPATEGALVRGGGITPNTQPNALVVKDGCSCNGVKGMPTYAVSSILVSLSIEDQPVSYVPAKGPATALTLTYNELESDQPAIPTFSNLGGKWTHTWLTYVQDDPANAGTNVTLYQPAGSSLHYKNYNATTGAFDPETLVQAVLTRVTAGGLHYERRMSDGSVWVYSVPDGQTTFPRRFFLTSITDPQGNAVTLTYDSLLRLTTITDAQGQSSTLSYANADPLKITSITDPFGRTATIGYDAAGRLNALTDAIGMQSTLAYTADSYINAFTTPYGTTSFAVSQYGVYRQLTITDPLGGRERVEHIEAAPGIPFSEANVPGDSPAVTNMNLIYRNSYYWDRNAMATAEGDYTKARIRHFLHDAYNYDNSYASGVMESQKAPLESRIWYTYPNQTNTVETSGIDKPNLIRRVLDDGTVQHTRMSYNAFGNVTSRIDPAGLETDYVYDTNLIDLLQVTEKNAAGSNVTVATYTYNSQHRPLTYVDAAGLTTTYTYNTAGQRRTATDSNGRVTTWQYDTSGRLLSVTKPGGIVEVALTYDSVGRVATRTNALGYTVTYTYDNLDRITRITHPDSTFEATTWDKLDAVSRTDRAGHTTNYTYDAQRRLLQETDALGHVTTYTYYPGRQLKTRTDANGYTRTYTRDLQGRVTSQADENEVTNYTYDGTGRITQTTRPDDSTLTFGYDIADRLKTIQDNLGNKVAYTLDLKGNRTKEDVTNPSSSLVQTHSRLYDSVYRLQQDIGAQSQTNQYAYDLYSNRTSATDPLSRVTDYTYDALNRLATETQPVPTVGQARPVISYAYNGLDQISQVTDPRGLITSYTYDGLGNRTQQVSPDTGTTTNTYDVSNNILTSTDAKGQVTTYTYDALNRVATITYNQATGTQLKTVAYTYDQGTNGIGHLTTVTETAANGTTVLQLTQYAYDQKGRIALETHTLAGNTNPYVTAYAYDPSTGLLQSMTYPSGRVLGYSYDALGRVNQIGTTAAPSQGGQSQFLVFGVTYHPFGGVKSYTLGNNRTVTRTYDQDGRIASYTLGGNSVSIGYDTASRITSLLDTVNAANSTSYGYDGLDRLTSASVPATSYTYAYDATGNRTSRTAGAATDLTTVAGTSNRISQVAGSATRTFSYDANGSTTADGNNTYGYDARGRMISAQNGAGTASYQVGANGQRVRKTSWIGDTVFLYDAQGKLIAETTPAGVVKKEYLYLLDIPVAVSAQ